VSEWNERIAGNVARVRERIASAAFHCVSTGGRAADEITLIAVSKTVPAEAIRAAYAAGVRHFGENRVQEWERKRAALEDLPGTVWHLIGGLQSNKVRRAAKVFDRVDSVDSAELAGRLNQAAGELRGNISGAERGAEGDASVQRIPILLEALLAPEDSKRGIPEADLTAVAEAALALPWLELRGLMCIPPYCENPEDARRYFRRLALLRDDLARRLSAPLPALSMGMSHDFEVAIEEGATEVRVGTAIFGERSRP
jgi:pyridoxal phosphate enzyme (YggS family)